ncbi:MAG TPA: DbpA RNA binding domain-containing protein [Gemmatimonadales bacterium]
MGFEELNVAPPAAKALAAMGWDTTHAAARDMAPTAARGNNLVAVVPPSPAYAAPALAGALGRIEAGAPFLLLVPGSDLDAWGALVHRLARELPLRIQVAHGEARALRRLRDAALDLLVATPATALSLLRRSALKAAGLGGVLIAWPERFESAEPLTELMHDVPKDAQRIVVTSDPARAADLVERYARKALTVTMAAYPPADAPAAAHPVRTAAVAWGRRVGAVEELVELLDPASVAVWAADRSYEDEIARAVPFGEGAVTFATADVPAADLVVAFDLPDAARLAQLRAAGNVVLLVPPGTEAYAARLAPKAPAVRLGGAVDAALDEAARRRALVAARLEAGVPERAMLTLAPLFERHDPSAVAAALFELWMERGGSGAAPAQAGGGSERADRAAAPGADAAAGATAKIWAGIGKNDGVTPADFVGTMTKELRVDRASIGRIELKDAYSLIEVPAGEAERIAGALNGITIRRKRVVARPDRGPSAPRERRPPRSAR